MTVGLSDIKKAITAAAAQYAKLVLVVGPHGAGKSSLLALLAGDYSTDVLSLGLRLSAELIDQPARLRPATASDRAGDLIRNAGCSTLAVVDNIELLFLPELKIDPLKLLRDAARNRVVVAAWPGAGDKMELRFAEHGHPEYRSYSTPDSVLVAI